MFQIQITFWLEITQVQINSSINDLISQNIDDSASVLLLATLSLPLLLLLLLLLLLPLPFPPPFSSSRWFPAATAILLSLLCLFCFIENFPRHMLHRN